MVAIVAIAALLGTDIRIDLSTPTFGIAWHPDGKRLFMGCEKKVRVWPSGQEIGLPTPEGGAYRHIQFSGDGKRMLVSNEYRSETVLIDLRRGMAKKVSADQLTWWVGNEIASVHSDGTSAMDEEKWSGRQQIRIGENSVQVPRGWQITAADPGGTVLLGKHGGYHNGRMGLFQLDTVRKRLRRMPGPTPPSNAEHVGQDSIDWNERRRMAILGLTSDTGSAYSRPAVYSRHGFRPIPARGVQVLHAPPKWVGGKVLLCIREFRELYKKPIGYGADIFRIRLFDLRTNKYRTLIEHNNRWTTRDGEQWEYPRRDSLPAIDDLAVTPNGERLAWLTKHGAKFHVTLRDLR